MKRNPLLILLISSMLPLLGACGEGSKDPEPEVNPGIPEKDPSKPDGGETDPTPTPIYKDIYFVAVGWFNTQAPTLNIVRYDKNNVAIDKGTYGTMMNHLHSVSETQTNVWQFKVDTSTTSKVQFFRTWDNGTRDGNARTHILDLVDFKSANGYKVSSVGTWYNGGTFTEVEPYLYKEEDFKEPETEDKPIIPDNPPIVDEDYPSEILVPEVKEIEGRGKLIKEDLTTTNIIDDNYRNYYEIFVGSYFDTNNDGIGDLQGVIKKLDYIKNSGFNGIWLMPIFSSPTYHKYDCLDYYTIDPSYGTMSDLDELIKECHKRDIKLILDMVVNHCSDKSEIFKKSADCYEKFINNKTLEEKEQVLKDYFAFSKVENDGSFRKYYKVPGKNFYVEGNFPGGMCEWNLDSIYTRKYFEDIYKFYIDKGIDGFRLDAVKYYYIESTTKTIAYLNEMSNYCKSLNKDFYIVGECWDQDPTLVSKYYESNVDSYFNFNTSSSKPNNYIRESYDLNGVYKDSYFDGFKASEVEAKSHIPAVFLDNHDMPRSSSTNLNRTKFNYALLGMHKGNTFAYYGDEIGIDGTNKNQDEDVRGYMNWSDENLGGLTLNPHGQERGTYYYPALNKQISDPYSIYNFYKKINFIRNQIPTIARGEMLDTSFCDDNVRILRIDKKYLDDEIEILMNFSEYDYAEYDYSESKYTDVIAQITAKKFTYIGDLGNKKLSIPPLGIAIIR